MSNADHTCHISFRWKIVFFFIAIKQMYEICEQGLSSLVFISVNKDPLGKMKVERGTGIFYNNVIDELEKENPRGSKTKLNKNLNLFTNKL